MEEITVTIPSSKDAELIKAILKKFRGVKVKVPINGQHNRNLTRPGDPVSWEEFNRQLKKSENQLRNGEGIPLEEVKRKMNQWRGERKSYTK